jgi:hypothetical protein
MENADLDCILGPGGQRRQQAKGKTRRGGKPAAAPRPPGDRVYGIEHRDVLCLTRATGPAPSRGSQIARSVPSSERP